MRDCNRGRVRQQISFLRRQFLQEGNLPFTDVLSDEAIAPALKSIEACWNDCVYTPLVTLWVFLGQVMSADHSCRAAVARLIAHRMSRGQEACSSKTGAYCQARKRLPEKFFAAVARRVGRALDAKVDPKWLWKGRRVYMFDGTTVRMPDTPENQKAYPQVYNQRPGLGFPIARIGAITSLSCGAVIDVGFRQYAGKGQYEGKPMRAWLFQDHRQKQKLGAKAPWSVGWIDPDGKRKPKRIGSKSQAGKFRRKIEGQLAAGTYESPSSKQWPQFREEYEQRILLRQAVRSRDPFTARQLRNLDAAFKTR